MMKNKILQEAQKDFEKMIKDRHFLHMHPETGFDLKETLSYVKNELEKIGFTPIPCGKAGLIAQAGGKNSGKVFLIRGDMDALPVREEADVEFRSPNGNMHACGHDMHTAMLLEAARILKAHEEEIQGTVKLMFQPAEEILEGAKDMIDHSVLENPKVDAGMMIHVMAGMPFQSGTAIVCEGGVSAPAADYFTIKIQGKGCHGSMPDKGIDPINVAAHIIIALQEINARELALIEDAILTICTINAGNTANVIPDTAILQGAIRAYDEEIRNFLKARINDISTHTATAFRAGAEVKFGSGCPTLINDKELSACTVKYIQELNGPQMVYTSGQLNTLPNGKTSRTSGSEDFAYVSHQIPTIMLALAAGHPDKGFIHPQHHPKVKFDDNVLPVGAAIYAHTAMRWLEEHNSRV